MAQDTPEAAALPLTLRGKTVLVITHDDKYFHLADRIMKLEDGRLDQPKKVNGERLEPMFVAQDEWDISESGKEI